MPPEVTRRGDVDADVDTDAVDSCATPSTRHLVARFSSQTDAAGGDGGDGGGGETRRKPVHKMTPPRQELASGVAAALGRPRPTRSAEQEGEGEEREEVEGEWEEEGEGLPGQGEFPEYGATALLLARWKTMETEGGQPLVPTTPGGVGTGTGTGAGAGAGAGAYATPPRRASQRSQEGLVSPASPASDDAPMMDGRTEDDVEEEVEEGEELVAACHTKSMLAKFKDMEAQAERDTTYRPSPKRVRLLICGLTRRRETCDRKIRGETKNDRFTSFWLVAATRTMNDPKYLYRMV